MAKTRDHPLQTFVQEVYRNTSDRQATQDAWPWNVFHLHSPRHTGSVVLARWRCFEPALSWRAYASGGALPTLSGRHAPAVVRTIVRGMLRKEGITIPRLGRMAVVPVSGSKPKLTFHGARGTQCGFG